MKKPIKNQLSLFSVLDETPREPNLTVVPISYRAALVEQVLRDFKVLQEDEWCHIPNTEFFANRIVEYRKTIAELDREVAG